MLRVVEAASLRNTRPDAILRVILSEDSRRNVVYWEVGNLL